MTEKLFKIIQERNSLAMIKSPELWPAWPVLPLRKDMPNGVRKLGIVVTLEGISTSTVFEVNLFQVTSLRDMLTDPTIDKHEFASPEALVADGWEVD
jgi:hypothetical protein